MGGINTRKFINSTWALLIGNGLFQVMNILFLLILVRVFDDLNYSCYRQGNLIIMTFSPLFVLGLPMTLSYFIPKTSDPVEKKAYVFQTIIILLLMGLVACILMMAFGGAISEIYNNELLKSYMWAFSIIFLVAVVYSYFPFYMISENKSKRMAVITVLFAAMKLASVVLSLMMGKNDFRIFITVFTITEVIKLVVVLAEPLHHYKNVKLVINKRHVIDQVKFALPICFINITSAFNRNLDKNLTSMFFSAGQFAIYANGAFDVPMINVLRSSIMGALFPVFSEQYRADDQQTKDRIIGLFRKSIVVVAMILIPLTGALMLYSKGAILVMFSERYLSSTIIFVIYMMMIPTQISDFGTLLVVGNKQKTSAYYTLLATVVLAVLYLLFYKVLGFNYVALAPVISQYMLIVLLLNKTKSVYGQRRFTNVFPAKELLLLAGVTAAICMVFLVLNPIIPLAEPLKSVILGGLALLCCIAAGLSVLKDYRELFFKSILRRKH